MRRIVFLSAFLSPFRSGAEAMVEEVSQRLADQFDVTVVTCRLRRSLPHADFLPPPPSPPPQRGKGARGGGTLPGGSVRIIRVGFGCSFDKYLFPILAPIRCLFLRPQIIHAVLESYAGLALVGCRLLVPWARRVLTLQSTNTSFMLGPIHRSAHVITAISRALVERAKSFGRSDVVLIPNGIDLQAIDQACATHPKDSGCVLFVGRLEPMKGVDVLLKAFAKAIVGLSPEVYLEIVGDGSQMRALKDLARELEIDHRIHFTGRVNHKAVLEKFARAEIFCGLSRSEALGNVFLEAQASGCAVLATNVGGIPDIVKDGESGLLVPSDDVDRAAAALRRMLTDAALRAKLSIAGKRDKVRYDWSAVARKYATAIG